jgi:outer membrane cobalamin receptor
MLLACHLLTASIKGKVMNVKGEPISNANVYWQNTSIGTVTNELGEFSISDSETANKLIISNVSYISDTIAVLNNAVNFNIVLNDRIQLSEVSVLGKTSGTIKLKSAVFNTEKITAAELCKAACCNLSESFETNPSVDVSYSDAATGAKQIKLLGLPGTYVQMLTENIPNLRGISAPYGMGFIPGPWMESIQVSKGTASVVNGYEAVTGQINIEFKKPPTSEKVALNVFASDAGRIESNLNASVKLNEKLSTGLLLHASDELFSFDINKDGFMDMPMVKQYNIINRWYYKTDKFISQLFVRALTESRHGGKLSGSYKIGIESERLEFFLKNGYIINQESGTSVALIISGSNHNQMSKYGLKSYSGKQNSLFSNLIFQTQWTHAHKLTAGINANFDQFNELMPVISVNPFLKKEFVSGIYGEYTYEFAEKFMAMGGIRADYNNLFGTLITPRMHLKYSLSEHLLFRLSAGKAYRSPNVMAENNFLLAGNRILSIAPDLKIEKAWNYGISAMADVDVADKEIMLTGEWYYTNFDQQVVTDMDSDPHKVTFSNLNGISFSHSAQIEASTELFTGFKLNVAHRVNIVKTTIGGVLRDKPLTNKSKSLITISYQTPLKKWQFDYTAQINGGGRMPDPDLNNPLWETTFAPFTIMNGQITKYFKTWSVYLGAENLTNFIQQNPIIDVENTESPNFDASMIWGPLHGRKIYLGFRWAINRD